MFTVQIYLLPNLVEIRGISALDERRRLGLADCGELFVHRSSGRFNATVSEGFARRYPFHFHDDINSSVCITDMNVLQKGDLQDITGPDEFTPTGGFTLRDGLSQERVVELWLASASNV